MSLVGNLEDLGLGDILQIVSLSRKSGVLVLASRNREGSIVFLNGQVIRATSSVSRDNLGDLLVRQGVVDLETLKNALMLQKQSQPPPRLGIILSENFGIPKDGIDKIVKETIENIVYSFFGWTEGTFSFELGEPEELAATQLNPLQFMLDQGLNPQWLAMEGSRIFDEKRHRGESLELPSERPMVDMEALLREVDNAAGVAVVTSDSAPGGSGLQPVQIYLVDDDVFTGEFLGRLLQELGYQVMTFSEAEATLEALERAVDEGENPVVVIDLIMPRMDGAGILGGMEVLEQVHGRYPDLRALLMSDHAHPDAERHVHALGLPAILAKPKKSDVRDEAGRNALQSLAQAIDSLLREEPAQGSYNFGADLLKELGEDSGAATTISAQGSAGLRQLKGMLQELSHPALGGGIILLVLRFASEFVNRAVMFLVQDEQIVGLGQFGIEIAEVLADARVRQTCIPTTEESIFLGALRQKVPMVVPFGTSDWDNYLSQQLGGKAPREVFLGPILSEGKVVAIIYGDNLPQGQPFGDTEPLEIFLSQAGLAMEKALLERRLRGRNDD